MVRAAPNRRFLAALPVLLLVYWPSMAATSTQLGEYGYDAHIFKHNCEPII